MDTKKTYEWMGKPTTSDKDNEDLERLSAVREFLGKMPRHEAEAAAYKEYKRKQHLSGATHHLSGMKQSAAAGGSDEQAKQHYVMYSAHMSALGHNPAGAVPDEISQHAANNPETVKNYKYKPHPSDAHALDQTK